VFSSEAIVSDDLCTGCGICVGACPTSTPFRRTSELIPGIDLPELRIQQLRDQTLSATAGLAGDARVIVYTCEHGPDFRSIQAPDVAVQQLPCTAMLPPAFIDFVITRGHADGVFLTGCAEGDCHYRLGTRWTEQRLAGVRDPYLRQRVPRERIATCWVGITHNQRLQQELHTFQGRLGRLPPYTRQPRSAPERPLSEGADRHG